MDAALPAGAAIGPVEKAQRISSVDVVRGFALLGILLMNITFFSLFPAAYDDPTVAGGATGANLWIWIVMHVLAEGKMRCLFSMIFGASFLLLTSRLDQRSPGSSADIYYRRTLWLLLFGIADAYLLWAGDILYPYALCALALYPFRNVQPRKLLIIGGILMVIDAGAVILDGYRTQQTLARGPVAEAAEKAGRKLTDEEKEAKKEWEEIRGMRRPDAEAIRKDADAWRGNLLSVLKARAKLVVRFHSTIYYHPWNMDVWSMMFIGMALLKLGILDGARSYRFYGSLAAIGYVIGISINSYTAWITVRSNFDLTIHTFSFVTYDLGRLSVALGHLAVLLLLCKSGALRWLTSRLAAIGQMAFSNYVFHSVVCTTLFTGFGFGLYGRLQRYQLYYVVAGIWIFQLIASPIWLRYFRMGPLEWCWRSLTYWKKQPMRVARAEAVGTAA